MGECQQKGCPCLVSLWRRIKGEKPDVPSPKADEVEVVSTPVKPTPPPSSSNRMSEPGSIYIALWDFEARHEDEMSFKEGDLFNVLSRSGEWWKARKIDKNGRVLDTGIVPYNYMERGESPRTQAWYFGTMNRFEAQGHLMSPENENGAFLIRRSDRDAIGYVLSVRSSTRVKHFKVLWESEYYKVEPSPQFTSLIDLVEHYSRNILRTAGRLSKPCKRKKPDPTDLNHLMVDEWELPKEEFTLMEELGSGYFADVYKGRWKNHINVAIKIIKSDSDMNHREFQKEVQILKNLRHRHLISLFAVCTASVPYYIVTELMEKGSLLEFLRGPDGQHQDIVSLVDMGAQVADGMAYLEEKNSIHRDLAARNVLVGEGYICKVGDFGLARVIKEPFYVSEEKKIPYKWTAPEAISHGRFSNKSDIWSFGILLYEIITFGGIPYPAFSNTDIYEQITAGYRMPCPPKCPSFLYAIMKDCWSEKPEDRPTFKTLKRRLDNSISSYEWAEDSTA